MTQKAAPVPFAGNRGCLGVAIYSGRKRDIFCAAGINDAHPTSENGKLAAFASDRPAFQKHAEHSEGSDSAPTSHTQKALNAGCTNSDFDKSEKDHAAQRGRDAFGTAMRISASLSRRLSVFFVSTPGQGPKAAKLAVLIPGPGMLVNVRNAPRVVIPPPSETPPVSACKPLCAILLRKPSVYPTQSLETNVAAFVGDV